MSAYPGLKHLLAVVLFGVAGLFYYFGLTIPTGIFIFLGILIEAAAWATAFGAFSDGEGDPKNAPTSKHEAK